LIPVGKPVQSARICPIYYGCHLDGSFRLPLAVGWRA
jgi:hypothetical protein